MTENEISFEIRGAIFKVYNTLGPGLLGLKVERQSEITILYDEIILDLAIRIDLLVEEKVIIEIKSVTDLAPIHFKQVTNYLKLRNKKLGILVNFNTTNILNDIKRIANKM